MNELIQYFGSVGESIFFACMVLSLPLAAIYAGVAEELDTRKFYKKLNEQKSSPRSTTWRKS